MVARRSEAPSLEETRRVTGEPAISVKAEPSNAALDMILSKMPNASSSVIDQILPRVERLMPKIMEARRKAGVPIVDDFSTPDLSESESIQFSDGLTPEDRMREARDDMLDLAPAAGGAAAPLLATNPVGFVGLTALSALGAGGGEVLKQTFSGRAEPTLEDKGKAVAREMALEVAGAGLIKGAGAPAALLRGNRRVADPTADALRRFGIQPSLQDVSDTTIVEGGRRILGSFPLLRKHFSKRLEETRKAFDAKTSDLLGEMSPDTLLMREFAQRGGMREAAEVNERIASGAFESLGSGYDAMRRIQAEQWGEVGEAAARLERTDGLFKSDMTNTAVRLQEVFGQLGRDRVLTRGGQVSELASGDDVGEAAKFLLSLSKEPSASNFTGLLGIKRRISDKINALSDTPSAVKVLTRVKEGVDEDISALIATRPDLKTLYETANETSSEFLNLLGELVGRRTRRYQRGGGRQQFSDVGPDGTPILREAGSRDPSEIVDALARGGTDKELRQLFHVMRKAKGEGGARRVFGDVLARKLSRALDGSIKEAIERGADPTYNPQNFLRLMGLDDPGSPVYRSTMTMFENAGVDARMVRDMSTVMQALFGTKNPKVSDFIARRGVLGGASSILSGATGGLLATAASSGTGMIGPATFFLLGRSYSKWMTDPSRARLVMMVANGSAQQSARSRAMASLLTDSTLWEGETEGAKELRREALAQIRTPVGRNQFFGSLDEEYALLGRNKREGR